MSPSERSRERVQAWLSHKAPTNTGMVIVPAPIMPAKP